MTNAKKITLGGLFLALGILLPQVAHLIAGPSLGQVLLPMHIPVLLGGFVLGPWFGCFLGAATPLISSLITGMPQAENGRPAAYHIFKLMTECMKKA